MGNNNLGTWNRLSKPPKSALKTIRAGRLKGMTDINPQWRLEIMTAVFGPCGIGWKYTIDKLWTEQVHGGEVLAFANVSLFVKIDDVWSEPIPGIGGNKLVASESRGQHNNDEAFKMALTDALSFAMKSLGVAAEIYAGRWDGSKYHARPEENNRQQNQNGQLPDDRRPVTGDKPANQGQLIQIEELRGKVADKFSQYCNMFIGRPDPGQITESEAATLIRGLKARAKEDPSNVMGEHTAWLKTQLTKWRPDWIKPEDVPALVVSLPCVKNAGWSEWPEVTDCNDKALYEKIMADLQPVTDEQLSDISDACKDNDVLKETIKSVAGHTNVADLFSCQAVAVIEKLKRLVPA